MKIGAATLQLQEEAQQGDEQAQQPRSNKGTGITQLTAEFMGVTSTCWCQSASTKTTISNI
jgi:hypothetical protein